MEKQKVIVICGPTASGKTALSIELAKKIFSLYIPHTVNPIYLCAYISCLHNLLDKKLQCRTKQSC